MFETFLILAVFIFVIVIALRKPSFKPPQSTHANPKIFKFYEAAPSVFVNDPERILFHMLSRAIPPGFIVLVKPRLEDIVGVKRDLPNPKLRWQLRARVKSRHLDYVIVTYDGRPVMGIELDGRSHNAKAAAAGDALKDGIFSAAGLPLTRIKTGDDFAAHIEKIMIILKSL